MTFLTLLQFAKSKHFCLNLLLASNWHFSKNFHTATEKSPMFTFTHRLHNFSWKATAFDSVNLFSEASSALYNQPASTWASADCHLSSTQFVLFCVWQSSPKYWKNYNQTYFWILFVVVSKIRRLTERKKPLLNVGQSVDVIKIGDKIAITHSSNI